MVYPSHWGPGEYGVANPNAQPYDITRASLADFRAALEGSGARLVPWLQDFSLGVEYGPAEVKAQIRAARDVGVREFLLWDPAVTYTHAALGRGAKLPATGERPSRSGLPAVTRAPNELGLVPVLMYHQLLSDGGGEYDLTPDEFRAELERLWREGYRPIKASDLVAGTIDVPKGTTPVVLTFDDATTNQAALAADGRIDPSTAAGILLEFAKTHSGFEPAATFYVNRDPFAAEEETRALLQALVAAGFELGNHTHDHLNLAELSDEDVQRQIVLGNRVIREYLPDAEIETFALPLGMEPQRPELALSGTWDGEDYRFGGVMLVGAEPAPSPYSTGFVPGGIPRVRSTADRFVENGSADWLDRLAAEPALRFVSDGDPERITVPAGREAEVASRFADRVQAAERDAGA
jgi:peptidoglycan/xylan/chitin deacetylase (PgdA/CDA1 family)